LLVFLLLFLLGAIGGGVIFRLAGGPAVATRRPVAVGAGVAEPETTAGRPESTARPAGEPVTPVRAVASENERRNEEITSGRHNAITAAARKAGKAVVTVGVIQRRYVRPVPRTLDPFDLFFDRYLPGTVYEQRIPGMGSGIIVDPTGVVLTNEHVVRDATEIKVILSDGRSFPARLAGSDPNWDLAVLKVEGEDLPFAELGDSDNLVVGEWAIAIGNPFGFFLENTEPTVTVGVVSALHRDIKGDDTSQGIYKDMIQTDAAINPGNSGGPLVNGAGEVVGINTFIFTSGGGSLGMGFAIPINTAKRIVDEIVRYGEVRKVWVGVRVQEITRRAARMLGLPSTDGVLVNDVDSGSPAEDAGVRVGDVIVAVNGEPVRDFEEARRALFGVQVGDRLQLDVLRKGEAHRFDLVMKELASGRGGGR
jgi:serine protease Do